MSNKQNSARTLIEKIWGTNFFDSIPAKWKSSLRVLRTKIPGVPNSTDPDVPTVVDVNTDLDEPITATSQVTTGRTNELEKVTEQIQANLLLESSAHGQELDHRGFIHQYEEHLSIDNTEVGDANKAINPLNPVLSEVREYNTSALVSSYSRISRGITRLELPPVLESLSAHFSPKEGSGQFTGNVGDCHWITSGSWSYSLRGEGQGSASIVAHCFHSVKQKWGTYVASNNVVFFMAANSTLAQILTRLTAIMGATVASMTSFNPTSITVLLISEAVSLRAEAQKHVQDGGGGVDAEEHSEYGGVGDSREHSVTIEALVIPPTLHGAISLSDSETALAGAAARADDQDSNPASEAVTAYVIASSSATSPTSNPTSGLKLIDLKSEPFYDVEMYFAEIVDMSLA